MLNKYYKKNKHHLDITQSKPTRLTITIKKLHNADKAKITLTITQQSPFLNKENSLSLEWYIFRLSRQWQGEATVTQLTNKYGTVKLYYAGQIHTNHLEKASTTNAIWIVVDNGESSSKSCTKWKTL